MLLGCLIYVGESEGCKVDVSDVFMSDLIKISPFNGLLSFIVSKDSLMLFQQAGM